MKRGSDLSGLHNLGSSRRAPLAGETGISNTYIIACVERVLLQRPKVFGEICADTEKCDGCRAPPGAHSIILFSVVHYIARAQVLVNRSPIPPP